MKLYWGDNYVVEVVDTPGHEHEIIKFLSIVGE